MCDVVGFVGVLYNWRFVKVGW